jgi:hypothetical protein
MPKSILTTIRFTPKEFKAIEGYLKQNPSFESFSSLGRVATMEFIRSNEQLRLRPITEAATPRRPWFLWDYDLTEAQAHEILQHSPFEQRKWLIARILERLRPPEAFRYLTAEQIADALPRLRMDPKIQRHWQEAMALWIGRTLTS